MQTRVGRHIPIILVDSAFWSGLLDWMRGSLMANGLISAEDLDLMKVVDDPADVVEAIFDFYQSRGFSPTPTERDLLFSL